VIEILKSYIVENQKNLNLVRDLKPQNDKWTGTVDYAVARLNTALLRLINDPLKLYEYNNEIVECQNIITEFVSHIKNYYSWPRMFKWIPGMMIHHVGTKKIPKVKQLLNRIDG